MQIHETRTEKISREDRSEGRSEVQAHDHTGATGKDAGFTEEEEKKFFNGIDRNGPMPDQSKPWYAGIGKCWIWPHNPDKNFYGRIKVRGKYMKAHRISWLIYKGEIPEGLWVLHRCDNPRCVNPDHLWLGTGKDNAQDRDKKGRGNWASGDMHGLRLHPESVPRGESHYLRKNPEKILRGEKHGASKLTTATVIRIRAKFAHGGITQRQIAKEESITFQTVNDIVLRKHWTHIA